MRSSSPFANQCGPAQPEHVRSQRQNGSARRILILDNDEQLLHRWARSLTEGGFEVEVASNDQVGLSLVLTGQFDVVIIDHKFGSQRLTGLDVLTASKMKGCRARCVYVAADGSVELGSLAATRGADCCLDKPVQLRRLFEVVNCMADEGPSVQTQLFRKGTARGGPIVIALLEKVKKCEKGRVTHDHLENEVQGLLARTVCSDLTPVEFIGCSRALKAARHSAGLTGIRKHLEWTIEASARATGQSLIFEILGQATNCVHAREVEMCRDGRDLLAELADLHLSFWDCKRATVMRKIILALAAGQKLTALSRDLGYAHEGSITHALLAARGESTVSHATTAGDKRL
jgi:DNA-binding response OmpR family regulator